MRKGRTTRHFIPWGNTVLTRQTQSAVSVPSQLRRLALVASFSVMACAGRLHPFAQIARAARAETGANAPEAERRATTLEFDNEATAYVDVYLVGAQIQWRLGRVPAGMHATLTVPESAIDWTTEFVRLAVIPGSHVSAEASSDPQAIVAIALPISEVLSQQWSFRQPAGAAVQLQAKRLLTPQ